MGRNLEPKCKQCRRVGEKLMLKGDRCNSPKCAMVKRSYIPGFHGPKSRGMIRRSDFGTQLNEKQKARKQYGLSEKQFRITFDKASKKVGQTGESLLQLLEQRLDNVIYRVGLASSRNQARQMVAHRIFSLNGRRVSIPSIKVKEGDVIKVAKKGASDKLFKDIEEKIKNIEIPGWISFNAKELEAKIVSEPKAAQIKSNINTQMIVEFYSK
ncbi:30S ribosomal protein S4 [Candidatus Falkowbacteria bacterium]|nr:30S ribosomal protein S4 [Candidatus Falkowbacteria bacterium]